MASRIASTPRPRSSILVAEPAARFVVVEISEVVDDPSVCQDDLAVLIEFEHADREPGVSHPEPAVGFVGGSITNLYEIRPVSRQHLEPAPNCSFVIGRVDKLEWRMSNHVLSRPT